MTDELFRQFETVPPCLCRLMARKDNGRNSLSHAELAKQIGISKSTVGELSQRTTWKGIKIEIALRFAEACGVDLLAPRRVYAQLKRYSQMHWQCKKNANRRTMFLRLMAALNESLKNGSQVHAQIGPHAGDGA